MYSMAFDATPGARPFGLYELATNVGHAPQQGYVILFLKIIIDFVAVCLYDSSIVL